MKKRGIEIVAPVTYSGKEYSWRFVQCPTIDETSTEWIQLWSIKTVKGRLVYNMPVSIEIHTSVWDQIGVGDFSEMLARVLAFTQEEHDAIYLMNTITQGEK
jgi:hypothetical protein